MTPGSDEASADDRAATAMAASEDHRDAPRPPPSVPRRPKRLQDELDAADARLRQAAQGFSSEWKAFLGYAMRLKQEEAGDLATFPDKNALEDLLLHSQSGLVMLREMAARRERKWRELLHWTPGTATPTTRAQATRPRGRHRRRPPPPVWSETPAASARRPERHAKALRRFQRYHARKLRLCYVFLTRRRLLPPNATENHEPSAQRMLQLLQRALVLAERLKEDPNSSPQTTGTTKDNGEAAPGGAFSRLTENDVEPYVRFQYLACRHRRWEHFLIRVRWLLRSHRYHIRQRMLEIFHQQQARNTPLSSAALLQRTKVSTTASGGVQCPYFPLTAPQLDTALRRQLMELEVPMVGNAMALRLRVDDIFANEVTVTRVVVSDRSWGVDGPREGEQPQLFGIPVSRSRWDLTQQALHETAYIAPTQQDYATGSGNADVSASETEPELLLLKNEWQLLSLDDSDYLASRLRLQAGSHYERAVVDFRGESRSSGAGQQEYSIESPGNQITTAARELRAVIGAGEDLSLELLEAFYSSRFLCCRHKRQRILRALNFFHFVLWSRRAQANEVKGLFARARNVSLVRNTESTKWRAFQLPGKCEFIVKYEDNETIFPEAMADLKILEGQLLRVANYFVAKQQQESVREKLSPQSSTAILAIDRMQVLADLYDCELRFQLSKLELAVQMLQLGHEPIAVFHSIDYGHRDALEELFEVRPVIDFSHAYFYESYTSETSCFDVHRSLYHAMISQSDHVASDDHTGSAEEIWLHTQLLYEKFSQDLHQAQTELLREAESLIFVPTSVAEYHCLRQAVLERMLMVWKTMVQVEGSKLVHSLELTGSDPVCGKGWQLSLSPILVTDVCASLAKSPQVAEKGITKVEFIIEATDVLHWREKLGLSVYETRLMEQIYGFQHEFVNVLQAGKSENPSVFFFDNFSERNSTCLRPIAWSIIEASRLNGKQNEHSRPTHSLQRTQPRTVSEWLDVVIRERQVGDVCRAHDVTIWFEQIYNWCLSYLIAYHDLIGGETVEFAATSPFYFLTTSRSCTGDTDLRTVKWKYMDEIVDKIRDTVEKTCLPLWIPLCELKAQIASQVDSSILHSVGGATADVDLASSIDGNMDATTNGTCIPQPCAAALQRCAEFAERKSVIARLLVALDAILGEFRNEHMLMNAIFRDDSTTKSVFRIRTELNDPTTSSLDSMTTRKDQTNLSVWLQHKLEQLQTDVSATDVTTPPAFATSKVSGIGADHPRGQVSAIPTQSWSLFQESPPPVDENRLLLDILSPQLLITMFAVPLRPTDEQETPQPFQLDDEEKEAALRALIEVYGGFSTSLSILRLECCLGFFAPVTRDGKQSFRRTSATTLATDSGAISQILKEWQTALHRAIRRLHDRIADRVDSGIGIRDVFVVVDADNVRRRHQLMGFRRELTTILDDVNDESRLRLRCAAMGVSIQCIPMEECSKRAWWRQTDLQLLLQYQQAMADDHTVTVAAQRMMMMHLPIVKTNGDLGEFWQILSKTRDRHQLAVLGDWLELLFAFIRNHSSRQLARKSPIAAERDPLEVFEHLVLNYRVFYPLDGESQDASDVIEGIRGGHVVSGTRLRMRSPNLDGVLPKATEITYLRRALLAVLGISRSRQNQVGATKVLQIPTITRLELHIEILRVYLEIQWIDDDVQQMQRHYENFLAQRRSFDTHQKQQSALRSSLATAQGDAQTSLSCARRLLGIQSYYRTCSPHRQRAGAAGKTDCGEFVIPADDMINIFNDITTECQTLVATLTDVQARMWVECNDQTSKLEASTAALRAELEEMQRDEVLKRESFAVDKTYQLQFRIEKQKQELIILQNRIALEQQSVRAELNDVFERRLGDLHVKLLAKQQKFDEYRQDMQRELKQQLQSAQSHLVRQLVDQSGSMSVESKTTFLASLNGQAAQEQLQQENIALKHTLLKLQTLYEMQQQTRDAHLEKERVSHDTHRMRETQLANENTHLQHHIKHLETEMAKISQERTFFQIKLANLQKSSEALAQRRREAKIRSLSAPFRRAHTPGEIPVAEADNNEADDTPSNSPELVNQQKSPARHHKTRSGSDYDSEQEAFEEAYGVAIRRQRPSTSINMKHDKMARPTTDEHFQNATRHFQSEIRRLQQQLNTENRTKAALMRQVTELKATNRRDTEPGEATGSLGLVTMASPRIGIVSPRIRASSASTCPPRRPVAPHVDRKRPATSFSPRATAHLGPTQLLPTPLVTVSSTDGPESEFSGGLSTPRTRNSASATPTRKFEVHKREAQGRVGGIEGTPTALSPREPLPYR